MILAGASISTGWGKGLSSLPTNAQVAAGDRHILPLYTPQTEDERLRRATRECRLAHTAIESALSVGPLSEADLVGPRTALIYASASSYVAANWAFLTADTRNVMNFPYTAPCAVPGEVSMRFGITGPCLSFLSGPSAGLEAIWYAATLLMTDQCDRAIVLGVETFAECESLYLTARKLIGLPLVETAFCLLMVRDSLLSEITYRAFYGCDEWALAADLRLNGEKGLESPLGANISLSAPTVRSGAEYMRKLRNVWPNIPISLINTRIGTCLCAGPVIGLLLALSDAKQGPIICVSSWGDTLSMLIWPSPPDQ